MDLREYRLCSPVLTVVLHASIAYMYLLIEFNGTVSESIVWNVLTRNLWNVLRRKAKS